MFKTIVSCWVPVPLAERLEMLARERYVTRSALIGDVLSQLVDGKPLDHTPTERGNPDGHSTVAREFIKANSDLSIPTLIRRLSDMGIKRGKTWVAETRQRFRSPGSGSGTSEE